MIVNFLKNNKSVKLFNIRHSGLTNIGLNNLYHQMIENKIEENKILLKFIFNQAGVDTYSDESYELLKYLESFTLRTTEIKENKSDKSICDYLYISNDPLIGFILVKI